MGIFFIFFIFLCVHEAQGVYTLSFAVLLAAGSPCEYLCGLRCCSWVLAVFVLSFCCCSSVVEHVLGKDGVMGSNPISS